MRRLDAVIQSVSDNQSSLGDNAYDSASGVRDNGLSQQGLAELILHGANGSRLVGGV